MELYDLIENMANMSYDVQIWDAEESEELFKGEVDEIRGSNFYSKYQFANVMDIYTLGDGQMVICIDTDDFKEEDEEEDEMY